MSTRFRWPALTLIATAVLLAGCPAPTGRRRGTDGGVGGTCPAFGLPTPGTSCSVSGIPCTSVETCPSGLSVTRSCVCTGSVWSCSREVCPDVRDSGTPTCPFRLIEDGESCSFGEQMLVCDGVAPDCDGTNTFVRCTCDGFNWSCPPPACFDGGRDDVVDAGDVRDTRDAGPDVPSMCPPMPSPGAMCPPGLSCDYPGGGSCLTSCFCRSPGVFACDSVGCDAGR